MTNPSRSLFNRQAGVSLIELLIAMVLGLLVLGAVVQLFIGSKSAYTSNEALARVQENGRFTMELLKSEFRDVGNQGFCAADLQINNHLNQGCANATDAIYDPSRAFVGWDYAGTGRGEAYALASTDLVPATGNRADWQSADGATSIDLPESLDGRVVPGSDVVFIRRAQAVPDVTAAGNTPANARSINLNNRHGLPSDALVLVTNCTTGADLFQNVNNGNATALSAGNSSCANPGPGNINGLNWATAYDESMQIFEVETKGYYVGYNETTGEPGLYRIDITSGTSAPVVEELVEGVETMQVLYGYSLPADQGGDGQTVNFWVPADEVPDWRFVIGVRMSLLLRSQENMDGDDVQRTFDLVSTQFSHPEDGRLRQPFTASISLRNRQVVL